MTASEHNRPETHSAYLAFIQSSLSDKESVGWGLRDTGLDVHFEDGEILHFDLEGRLLRIARPYVQWKRGLSGRMLKLRRRTRDEGGALERTHVPAEEAEVMVAAANERTRAALTGLSALPNQVEGDPCQEKSAATPRLYQVARKAAAFDVAGSEADLAEFRYLYHDIPILPPDQYNSLVLLASDGCRYNKCTFCNFYRDVSYRARPLEQFQEHTDRAVQYHGHALALRRHIFLGQANALLGPRSWREEILRYVNARFELPAADSPDRQPQWWKGSPHRFTGITSFLDAFVGARLTAEEFVAMRQLNLRQIYIGMESGSQDLLEWLRKPADPAQMLETVQAAKQGGVAVGVIVLVGAGGEQFFDKHVQETQALIRAMQLTAGDYVYLSPLVPAHGAEYARYAADAGIVPLTTQRIAEQEKLLRAGVARLPTRQGPYVSHYEVEHFIY